MVDCCLSRRDMLRNAAGSFLSVALAGILSQDHARASLGSSTFGLPHFPARAKSVIYLYMEGGPSQIDTFDPKPRLDLDHGKELPLDTPNTVFEIGKTIMKSPFSFAQYGESGAWVSDILPEIAKCVDDLTIVRSMYHDFSDHSTACYLSHTGHNLAGRPSVGAWVNYGLGSECQNLPGFIVMDCGMGPSGGAQSWGAGFLPPSFQGALFGKSKDPVDDVNPLEATSQLQTQKLHAVQELNRLLAQRTLEPRLDAIMKSYETAFHMQTSIPDLMDFRDESSATRRLYGLDEPATALFGSRCLMARRLVERGVRFIEVLPPNLNIDRWDQHQQLAERHRQNALATDRPVAALIIDLKQRGLLDETIVLWGGEFGRTPNAQGSDGRDHNPFGYTIFLAGGGFKPGIRYGNTDEFGYFATENKVHLHDLHATLLHQLGIDHKRLTYRYQGRDFRLTDVHGEIIKDIIS